jgi:hypothetical protein
MKPYLLSLVVALFSISSLFAQAELMPAANTTVGVYDGKATCKTMTLATTSIVPAGSYLIACTDGTSGLVWNGINNKQIFPLVSYCPLTFNENGFKAALSFTDFYVVIDDVNYQIVGSATASSLSLLPLLSGTYNTLHGQGCSFSVDDEGVITYIKN